MSLLLDVVDEAIRSEGGDDTDTAGLIAGLLIERAWTGASCEGLLDEPFLSYEPTSAEIGEALDRLLVYLSVPRVPHVYVARALARSNDPRVVPALIRILERVLEDPAHESLALVCLSGIVLIDWGNHRPLIKRASESTLPSVRQFAMESLAKFR